MSLVPVGNAWQDWWVLCKHIYQHEGWLGFFRGFGKQEKERESKQDERACKSECDCLCFCVTN